jgi:hypothetical protein
MFSIALANVRLFVFWPPHRGQMRVKYFCIFSILSDSNGQCLSNAKTRPLYRACALK